MNLEDGHILKQWEVVTTQEIYESIVDVPM